MSAMAELSVASLFSDHAVLQRNLPVPVWGTGIPSAKVNVNFRTQTKTTTTDPEGNWRLKLDALKAGGPDTLTVVSGQDKVTITDVLVGEVWVGSGQSNMAGGAGGYAKRDPTLAKLIQGAPYASIRLLRGGPKPNWREGTADAISGFSAILFSFGERLHRDLDVPVGLILGAVGGTPSGAWLSQDAYDQSEACKMALAEFAKTHNAAAAMKSYQAKLAAWEKRAAEAKAKGEKPKGRKPAAPAKTGPDDPRPSWQSLRAIHSLRSGLWNPRSALGPGRIGHRDPWSGSVLGDERPDCRVAPGMGARRVPLPLRAEAEWRRPSLGLE